MDFEIKWDDDQERFILKFEDLKSTFYVYLEEYEERDLVYKLTEAEKKC